jgi:ubiquinone/menaquinone biosynthesis C-methylase UbiE
MNYLLILGQKMTEHIKYDNHEEEWEKVLNVESRKKIASTWLEKNKTINRWRHDRMYKLLKPLINFDINLNWLTVGDGRYGTDANALLSLGVKDVMCTDISDKLLRIGNENGFINQYSAENAENMSFENESFDFVLCKEAYHHFPRPHIALHEMFRVSKVGVILIEPCDAKISTPFFDILFPFIKKIRRKILNREYDDSGHAFEPVGNYVFSISERELEKIQLGMHRRFIAFNNMNDYYESGYEFIKLDSKNSFDNKKIKKTKFVIKARDILVKYGLATPGIIFSILFKSEPDPALLGMLKKEGWNVRILPKNPYLTP